MGGPRLDDDTLAETYRVYRLTGCRLEHTARQMGVSKGCVEGRLRLFFRENPHLRVVKRFPPPENLDAILSERGRAVRGETGGPPIPDAAVPPEGFVIRRNSAAYDKDGNLTQQWIESGQGNTDGWEIPAGHVVKGESAYLDANNNLIGRWIKTREGSGEGFIEALKEAFAEFDGAAPEPPPPPAANDDLLTVYTIPDLHLGAYSWADETGTNYDVKIATRMVNAAVDSLVAKSDPSTHAVVLILGDFFHQNDQTNVTPGHKHQLDVDGRWPYVYRAGANVAISTIDKVARHHEKVTPVIIPGNHDPHAAHTLSVALDLYYSQIDRINVAYTPGVFWYMRFGKNLLGANHGHTMKTASRMAGAMAVDRAEDWGQTTHRFIWTGHLHHEKSSEEMGVLVFNLTSPAARDAWNSASGYRSNRTLEASTLHKNGGIVSKHYVNISGAAA